MSSDVSDNEEVSDRMLEFLHTVFVSQELSALSIESKCKNFCRFYNALEGKEKMVFLRVLTHHFGVNQESVIQVSQSVVAAQERGEAILLKVEERLRSALIGRYQQLFSQIGRIEGGVKFLVDLRADALNFLSSSSLEVDSALYRSLQSTLRELLALWFSVGFLNLQRITWESPCDMVQKISDYEAVHPIRNWADLKQRVGPYRRCFVFTHSSMPREPVVVLHTALTNEISASIHTILENPGFASSGSSKPNSPSSNGSETPEEMEDPNFITTAVFYSITSTQRGLQGVDLGNYLIKKVVRELQSEYPRMSQFSSLSPIPGFREWLLGEVNRLLHLKDIGESPDEHILLADEIQTFRKFTDNESETALHVFKKLFMSCDWAGNDHLSELMKAPLMRLCARYLYIEKRRSYALNPVANFHLQNGATLWRLNWKGDLSMRGLAKSCGMMVNYRYFLDNTEHNSKNYLENHVITASDQIHHLVKDIRR